MTSVHHLAFAVRELERGIALFQRLTGREPAHRGPVSTRGAEVAVFKLDNLNIEVVAPTDPGGSLAAHLDAHGEGFFHLAFGVDDVAAAAARLEGQGIGMRSPPYVAFRDWEIAYLRSEDTGGIPMHLIQRDAD
nr:VOC family protein [Methylonatrum kenyense]